MSSPLIAIQRARMHLAKFHFALHCWLLHKRNRSILIGKRIELYGKPILTLKKGTSLTIGKNCILRSALKANGLGINHPVIFCTLRERAAIVIEDGVGISGGALCAMESIVIGAGTLIGANTIIADNDFHPIDPFSRIKNIMSECRCAPISIGKNVFIGTGAIILKGVSIGDNTVIGAGSIVSRSIPANVVAAGNPCRPLTSNESSRS